MFVYTTNIEFYLSKEIKRPKQYTSDARSFKFGLHR